MSQQTGKVIFGCVGVVAIFGLGWVLGFGSSIGFWTEITAAWVQAVGSVSAILAAVWIAWNETQQAAKRAHADRRQAHLDRLEPIAAIADQAVELADEAEVSLGWLEMGFQPSLFEDLIFAVGSIPLHIEGSVGIAKHLLEIKRGLEGIKHASSVYHSQMVEEQEGTGPGIEEGDEQWMLKYQAQVRSARDGIRERIQELQNRRET